jgi:uncharacterized protein
VRFEIPFYGHKNVRAFHPRTIEITTESDLTVSGDCIIGVNAECGCADLPKEIKDKLKDSRSRVKITIQVNDNSFIISGSGHDDLVLENPHDIVIRKSSFLCPRTLAINCDKACDEIPRKIIKQLQDPKTRGLFVIDVT